MNIYVESNFVLELAFLQEEHACCSEIVDLAASGRIHLCVPAFCLSESYEAWNHRANRRKKLHTELHSEINELSRTLNYQKRSEDLRDMAELLTGSAKEERIRINSTLSQLWRSPY